MAFIIFVVVWRIHLQSRRQFRGSMAAAGHDLRLWVGCLHSAWGWIQLKLFACARCHEHAGNLREASMARRVNISHQKCNRVLQRFIPHAIKESLAFNFLPSQKRRNKYRSKVMQKQTSRWISGKQWRQYLSLSLYIYIYISPLSHEKARFWSPKNQVIYRKNHWKCRFWGPMVYTIIYIYT